MLDLIVVGIEFGEVSESVHRRWQCDDCIVMYHQPP